MKKIETEWDGETVIDPGLMACGLIKGDKGEIAVGVEIRDVDEERSCRIVMDMGTLKKVIKNLKKAKKKLEEFEDSGRYIIED